MPVQPIVVQVRMRDHNPQQTVVRVTETGDLRKQAFMSFIRCIERKADIQGETFPLCLNLNARAANLLCPPMYTDSHSLHPLKY